MNHSAPLAFLAPLASFIQRGPSKKATPYSPNPPYLLGERVRGPEGQGGHLPEDRETTPPAGTSSPFRLKASGDTP